MDSLLFTGASGFLGANTLPALRQHYCVTTLGRTAVPVPTGAPGHVFADLAEEVPELPGAYRVVLHAAGMAHVTPLTDAERRRFYDVNVRGTEHLCQALERVGVPSHLVFISSVSVYGCTRGEDITEDAPLLGTSPYAASKIQAEEYLRTWCSLHGVSLTILRPALMTGINAPGNLGAMAAAIRRGRYANIGGGKTRKSMLVAADIATLVVLADAAAAPSHIYIYNVCHPEAVTVGALSAQMAQACGRRPPLSIPRPLALAAAYLADALGSVLPARVSRLLPLTTARVRKISSTLTFSPQRAITDLGWKPTSPLENLT